MAVSNMKTCLICLAIISMVAAAEVLPVDAAATPLDGGASNLSFNRRLLQVPANPWHRGCSRLTRCRGGSRRPGGPGVQGMLIERSRIFNFTSVPQPVTSTNFKNISARDSQY
ncbi:hypothetical protein GQ457_02G037920 [Hibiscus cannabinus]